MKLPRLITRRRLKWIGLATVVITVGLTTVSVWYCLKPAVTLERRGFTVMVCGGQVGVAHFPRVRDEMMKSMYHRSLPPTLELTSYRWIHEPIEGYPDAWLLQFPAVWLVVLLALPTAYLWYTDRRAKPWQCATCRYDLRGLDGGVCPECGTPITDTPA